MSKKVVRRKAAGRKAAGKKTAKKRSVGKRATSRKIVRKKTARRKTASRKAAAKKTVARKKGARKTARKKVARQKKVSYVAAQFHSVTPHIVVSNGNAAIDFYKKAFGAVERFRLPSKDGKGIMHAEIMVGDSVVMLGEESPGSSCKSPTSLGGSPVTIHLYVPDADAVYRQAVAAGASGRMPPVDMFWGDRYGQIADPFGHIWSIATHLRDPSPEEMAAGMAAMGQPS